MPPSNAREYLFETLFKTFRYNEFNLDVIEDIKNAKATFDNAKSNITKALIADVKSIFNAGNKAETSLSSSIKDWYEKLKPTTVNHLFSNNEDKVLSLMKNITNDEKTFVERLGKSVIGLRIDDWKTETIKEFYEYLVSLEKTVSDFDKNTIDQTQSPI